MICPRGSSEQIRKLANERLPRKIDELDLYLSKNEIIRARGEGVGVLTPEQAIAYSAVGPLLRASGVPYDLRRADPYSIYDRFEFDVAVRYHGDIYDRFMIRMDEMRQSVRILQQAVRDIPKVRSRKASPSTRCASRQASRTGVWKDRKASWVFMSSPTAKPIPGATMSGRHRSST